MKSRRNTERMRAKGMRTRAGMNAWCGASARTRRIKTRGPEPDQRTRARPEKIDR